ncbi:hypothetical protein DNTS_033480 [Danionella cerebrum]|uniref:Uncharacterized protein n=1 Tax=Danionella cerebrum TaxID=2873325 RepID=A0A553PE06_9TELE|nr:hypothetical protein DNTS_033480 [Danionella translucida]
MWTALDQREQTGWSGYRRRVGDSNVFNRAYIMGLDKPVTFKEKVGDHELLKNQRNFFLARINGFIYPLNSHKSHKTRSAAGGLCKPAAFAFPLVSSRRSSDKF